MQDSIAPVANPQPRMPPQACRVDDMDRWRKIDPLQWSGVDRCLLWLVLVLGLFVFYLFRVDYLLEHAGVEPYFDRRSLALFRRGLVAAIAASVALLLIGLALRRRTPENRWILHAANQVWWVWTSLSAYAVGPLTTPILGLLLLGGFVSILLFPRRVFVPAMASGMLLLAVTTAAERADLLPYAPLFGAPLEVGGRLPTPYVVGTGVIALGIIVSSFVLISYLVERGRSRERELLASGRERERARRELEQTLESLERRIEERTAELSRSNARLTEEAAERRSAEAALRESETRLREQFTELEHLYQNAPIGLCLHDSELRYVRINERLAAINGRDAAAHIGRTVWEMIPEIAETVGPIMRRVLETGEPALDLEVHASTPAEPDTERYWLTSYYPVKSSDGRVLGVSAVVQDISEVKWAEERARKHLESLAHVARLSTMGQMATGIAHELNQPLAAIVNYASAGRLKLDEGRPADVAGMRALLDRLSAEALRAGGIVHHLRAFVNKAQPERVTTSVNPLIRDVLMLVGSEFRLNGIRPVLRLDETLAPVRADVIQLQQVVLNLVRNALDAMAEIAPAQRRLTITSKPAGDRIEVAVCDTGKGVPAGDADHVFDSFYTTKREGMGMGLAISRSIIEDHGGRLWLEPNPEEGVTFRFTLPAAKGNVGPGA
jgi:PAS domain S-box-containing protein